MSDELLRHVRVRQVRTSQRTHWIGFGPPGAAEYISNMLDHVPAAIEEDVKVYHTKITFVEQSNGGKEK